MRMAIDSAWAVVAGVAVSAAGALVVAWKQQEWTHRNLLKSQAEEDARRAAQRLLDMLDEVRHRFRGVLSYDVGSSREHIYELCYRLKREIIMLPKPQFRERFDKIHDAVWDIDVCGREAGQYLQQVATILYAAGEELVGAYSKGDPVPPATGVYQSAVVTYHETALAHEAEVERQLKEQERGPLQP
jgi:hypothetical protein